MIILTFIYIGGSNHSCIISSTNYKIRALHTSRAGGIHDWIDVGDVLTDDDDDDDDVLVNWT